MPTLLLLLYGVSWTGSMDAVTITCRNRPGLLAATRIGEASNPGPWHNDDAGIAGADLRDRSPAHHLDVANCVNMPPRSEVHGGGVRMPTSNFGTTPTITRHSGEDAGIGDYGAEDGLDRGYALENSTILSLDALLPSRSTMAFRPCREYDGPHPGMVFRLGSHGLGFYPDCGYVDDYLVTGADAASQQFVGPCLPPHRTVP